MAIAKGNRVRLAATVKEFGGQTGEVVKITAKRVWVVLDSDVEKMSNPIRRKDVAAYTKRCEEDGSATRTETKYGVSVMVPFYTVFEDWAIGVDPRVVTKVDSLVDVARGQGAGNPEEAALLDAVEELYGEEGV